MATSRVESTVAGCPGSRRIAPIAISTFVGIFLWVFTTSLTEDQRFALLVSAFLIMPGFLVLFRKRRLFDIGRLALPGLGLASYVVLIAIPAWFVFFDHHEPGRHAFFLAVQSVLLTLPLGVLLGERWVNHLKPNIASRDLEVDWKRLRLCWDALFAYACIVVLLHYVQVGFVPLKEALFLRGDALAAAELREESGRLLPGLLNQYLYFWNRIMVLPGLVLLALGACRRWHSKGWIVRLGLAALVTLIHATFTLEKSFSVIVFVALAAFLALMGGHRIRLRVLATGTALGLLFPLVVFWWILPEDAQTIDILFAVGKRIFFVPAEVTYFYFELVPRQIDFSYGSTSRVIALITGSQFFDLANYLFRQELPQGIETGSANACFVGSAWANFGWFGVLAVSFLTGIILQFLNRVVRQAEDILAKVLHALLVVPFTVGMISVPTETILLSYGVIPAILALMMIRVFVRKKTSLRATHG